MIGLPAASAEAVSPPATENARGKLLEPKTATGPSGLCMDRIEGLGKGYAVRVGMVDAGRRATNLLPHLGKMPQLIAGARRLALEPGFGQGGFQVCPLDDRRRGGLDRSGNVAQEGAFLLPERLL